MEVCIGVWEVEWMDKWADEKDRRMDGRTDGRADGQMERKIVGDVQVVSTDIQKDIRRGNTEECFSND